MTKGEKMVWAATFARERAAGYNREEIPISTYVKNARGAVLSNHVKNAQRAVLAMREARGSVVERWGENENQALIFLDEMLSK